MTRPFKLIGAVGAVLLGVVLSACGQATGQTPPAAPEPTAPAASPADPATAAPAATGEAPTAGASAEAPTAAPSAETPTRTLPTPQSSPVPVPQGSAGPALGGVSGETPRDLLAAMVADLAGRLAVDSAAITVVSDEAITWPDGSIGCPQPGMLYPQVLIDGYKVVLDAGGVTYPYHSDGSGTFFLCEAPKP